MTYAAVGAYQFAANNGALTTFSCVTSSGTNFILCEVISTGTRTATGLSSSNATWVALGSPAITSNNTAHCQCFLGTVTSGSTQTVTITWGAGSAGTFEGTSFQQFSTTTGIPVLDKQATLDSAGTNTWPSLAPAVSGELYFGYVLNATSAVHGSTSGYVYNDSDGLSNGSCYNLNVTASTAPVWADAGESAGIVLLVMPATTGGAAPIEQKYRRRGRSHTGRRLPQQLIQQGGTGAIQNNLTLTGVATGAGVQVVQVGKVTSTPVTALSSTVRAIGVKDATTATASATANRQIRSNVAGSATASGNVLRQIGTRLPGPATASATLATLKSKLLSLTASSTASAALGRTLRLNETAQATGSGSLTRGLRITYSATPTASAIAVTIKTRLMSLVTSITASGALRNQVGRILGGTATASGATVRQVRVTDKATVTASSTVTRFISSRTAALVNALPTVATMRVTLMTFITSSSAIGKLANRIGTRLPGQATSTGNLVNSIRPKLATNVTSAVTIRRFIAVTDKATATASSTMTTVHVTLVTLLANASAAASVARRVGTQLAGQVTSNGALFRRLPARLAATATASTALAVSIGKRMSGQTTVSASVTVLKIKLVALNALATAQSIVKRSIRSTLTGNVTAQPTMFRFFTQKFQTVASAIGNVSPVRILSSLLTLTKGLAGRFRRDRIAGTVSADDIGGTVGHTNYTGDVRTDIIGGSVTRDIAGGKEHA